jgi:energy-coupling factor transporter ATP-binding protein EcfA2
MSKIKKFDGGFGSGSQIGNDSKIFTKQDRNFSDIQLGTDKGQSDYFQKDISVTVPGSANTRRAHVTRSLTPKNGLDVFVRETPIRNPQSHHAFPFKSDVVGTACGYAPDPNEPQDFNGVNVPFLLSTYYLPLKCLKMIESHLERGLIVVCGETGCGKSEFVQKLNFLILEKKWSDLQASKPAISDKECLHYITFEDPVEKPFYINFSGSGSYEPNYQTFAQEQVCVQVTHRERGVNCKNVKDFFASALRQKPALAFVGETRDKDDWEELISFAMTGHLAITTCHAGSVQECLSKMIIATGGERNPAKRSFLANALVCVIHLKATRIEGKDITGKNLVKTLILPSLYIFNKAGMAKLIADNLDAVQPSAKEPSLGYTNFLNVIKKDLATRTDLADWNTPLFDKLGQAVNWDLGVN